MTCSPTSGDGARALRLVLRGVHVIGAPFRSNSSNTRSARCRFATVAAEEAVPQQRQRSRQRQTHLPHSAMRNHRRTQQALGWGVGIHAGRVRYSIVIAAEAATQIVRVASRPWFHVCPSALRGSLGITEGDRSSDCSETYGSRSAHRQGPSLTVSILRRSSAHRIAVRFHTARSVSLGSNRMRIMIARGP